MKPCKIVSLWTLLGLIMVLTACTPEVSSADSTQDEDRQSSVGETGLVDQETETQGEEIDDMKTSVTTPIIIQMNDITVRASLNDTQTAREFMVLLPYSLRDSRDDSDPLSQEESQALAEMVYSFEEAGSDYLETADEQGSIEGFAYEINLADTAITTIILMVITISIMPFLLFLNLINKTAHQLI